MTVEAQIEIPHRKLGVDFYVGLFAIIGVLCFAYLAINLAGIKLSGRGYYEVKAVFSNISGLEVGAPVEIAGVPVGEISKVELDDSSALVTLLVKDGVILRDDDIAAIRTKGIIGDKYIKISPGGSDKTVPKGGEIKDTESSVEFEEIIGKLIHQMNK